MERYLVIQLARFGDLLQTKRLLATLAAFSDAETHLVVDSSLADLARQVYPRAIVHDVPAHASGPSDPTRILGKTRKLSEQIIDINPTLVFNLNYSGLNFALATLFDPSCVRGYTMAQGQPDKTLRTSQAFRWMRDRRRSTLNLTDLWALHAREPIAPEAVNPPALGQGKGIGVVVSGRHDKRSARPEALAAVATALMARLNRPKVYLLGTKDDGPRARQWMRHWNKPDCVTNLVGRTALTDLADILQGLDFLITPDTGTMHLGTHLGVPVTALFMASAWCHETGPYGRGHTILQAVRPCAPCLEAAPCLLDEVCHDAFTNPRLIRNLATGRTEIGVTVPDLLILGSHFDSLGVLYRSRVGQDSCQPERDALRSTIMASLGICAPSRIIAPAGSIRERDWMLPFP